MSMLSVNSLSVKIGNITVCDNLSLEIKQGEYWGVLGGNGIGKTTFLHTLAGLRPAYRGTIHVEEKKLEKWTRRDLARKVGVLFQDSVDTFPVSVLETAMTGRYPHLQFWSVEGRGDYDIVHQVLSRVELQEMAYRPVNTLSGGERRRLAIATLMVQNPLLWLLDEPTNHLDLHHQINLLKLLINQVRDMNGALVMVLHDVNLVTRFCTHVILMLEQGNILCGPVSDIVTSENLNLLYRHPIREFRSGDECLYYPQ